MCEARHNSMLSRLGSEIVQDIENIRLIAIAGPSSSGKTTFCNRLRIELLSRGINPVTISMDDYYFTKDKIAQIQNKPIDQLDLEHINCLDIEQFNKDLFDLINGEEVTLPIYDFTSITITDEAHDFDKDGNPVNLSDYFGKPIVLNFCTLVGSLNPLAVEFIVILPLIQFP